METILLNKKNAHRVTLIRRKDEPQSTSVAFHFRGKQYGYCSYSHLIGDVKDENVLPPDRFDEWEVVETAYPGYLEDLWEAAYHAHYWSSQHPEECGESEIISHEKELHADLTSMPESDREQYLANYRKHLSGLWATESNVASAFVTGPAKFNTRRNEKANQAYYNKLNAFKEWRERALKAIERRKEASKTDDEKAEETWQRLKTVINDSASTIVGIDTGVERGYSRSLFVANLFGKIATLANNGNVEVVDKAIDYIRQWNAKVKKPIFTERHKVFKLPEVARNVRKQAEERAGRESKEIPFEGGTVIYNYEIDRLQIVFDGKPDDDLRSRLKKAAFKWSPNQGAWQRQLTRNAIYATGQILNIQL